MNTEHTPGPWRVGDGSFVISDHPTPGITGSDDVHFYGGHLICESVSQPNARLIASAPDLLEALKLSLIEHKDVRGFLNARISRMEPVHKWLKETEQMIGMIESAIAKAEGKA